MTNISTNFSSSRNWLSSGYRNQVSLTISNENKLPKEQVSSFCFSFLSQVSTLYPVFSKQYSETFVTTNMRGRQTSDGSKEELCYLQGLLTNQDGEDTKLSVSLNSSFDSFHSSNEIVYACLQSSSGFPKDFGTVTAKEFTMLFPLEITRFRLGFEFFRKKNFGSMFGLFPKIEKRFYLTLTPTEVGILLSDECVSIKTDIPFFKEEIFTLLTNALTSSGLANQGLVDLISNATQ